MKSIIIPACLVFFTLQACSQELNADKVPSSVKTSFAKAHPNVKGKWEKEKENYEVTFKEKGKEMSCVINASGAITETETEISSKELPQPAKDYISKNYPGKKIKEAAKIVNANGTVEYEAEVADYDLIFDTKGAFVRADKKSEEDEDKD